jgi:hypothetical protein
VTYVESCATAPNHLTRHGLLMEGCRSDRLDAGANRCRRKAKGRFSFESRPLLSDFRRPGSVPRSQLLVTPEGFGSFEPKPALPVVFRHSVPCKSFLVPSIGSQFPDCFCEFRCRASRWLLSSLFCWRIAPPVIQTIPPDSRECNGSVKRYFCGNKGLIVEMGA